jgi:hypothetical protein
MTAAHARGTPLEFIDKALRRVQVIGFAAHWRM